MLGAFRSFVGELKQNYRYVYLDGQFDVVIGRLERLSVATTEEAVELSDRCVSIAKSSMPCHAKLFFIERAIEQFGREMSGLNS